MTRLWQESKSVRHSGIDTATRGKHKSPMAEQNFARIHMTGFNAHSAKCSVCKYVAIICSHGLDAVHTPNSRRLSNWVMMAMIEVREYVAMSNVLRPSYRASQSTNRKVPSTYDYSWSRLKLTCQYKQTSRYCTGQCIGDWAVMFYGYHKDIIIP